MPRDVNTYLTTQQANSSPEIAKEWAILEELYNKKLWHQITLKLQEFVKSPELQQGTALIDLYENFLAEFENRINPLSLVEIITFIVQKIEETEKTLEFLIKTKEKVKGNTKAIILCNIIMGHLRLKRDVKDDLKDVKKLIEETEELIDSLDGITSVHGRYYQLCSDYYQVIGQHSLYYRDALRYLGCTELADIPIEEQKSRAFTLSLAAILGEGVYNFGELLAHPILQSLKGGDQNWVVDLLFAFNSGSMQRFEDLRSSWEKQPDLKAHELALQQKICLLCLMEMTFKRPGNHRILTFADIAKDTRLNENQVELLVMKALSLGLVKGSIDQVDKKVHMYWVQPRVLDKNQIATMEQRLDHWCKDVRGIEGLLEKKAQDILT